MSELSETSTGHALSEGGWLDTHYASARAEYEEGLRWVGIEAGWRLLDAGAGGGAFLPLLSHLAGGGANVTAVDLAPENIERIRALASSFPPLAGLAAEVGSILALPFPDEAFDCVWCANVAQYLWLADLDRAIGEFCRVLKPGGVLAIKEFDGALIGLHPIDPDLLARWQMARRQDYAQRDVFGVSSTESLHPKLSAARLQEIRLRGWLVERRPPLSNATRAMVHAAIRFWAQSAQTLDLSAEDKTAWARLHADPASLIDATDFCFREGFIVAVGRKPR
ncbi:MAG: methyltransferase domain-containing protein [Acetobacteraceae bacterium]|nr:methyltransferase domain-containing protein [Acetobacteraceae bacterium]